MKAGINTGKAGYVNQPKKKVGPYDMLYWVFNHIPELKVSKELIGNLILEELEWEKKK